MFFNPIAGGIWTGMNVLTLLATKPASDTFTDSCLYLVLKFYCVRQLPGNQIEIEGDGEVPEQQIEGLPAFSIPGGPIIEDPV